MNTENNKLIAEFIGIETFKDLLATLHNGKINIEIDIYEQAKFHSDWNWLMEVVDKIENSGFWTECRKQLGGIRFVIGDEKDFFNQNEPIVNVYKDFKIDAIYTACVKFIEWNNQQNQKP